MKIKHRITREQCQERIRGVCEGCGGKLIPIETVDNSGNPTFWTGCSHCQCFRAGVDEKYFKIARQLVDEGTVVPYSHIDRSEYHDPKKKEYYLDTQTAGLSHTIEHIDKLLRQ